MEHPHGSVIEQVHRVLITESTVDPWIIAEELVKYVREDLAREFDRQSAQRDPEKPVVSVLYSHWAAIAADRIRNPEKYSGMQAGRVE